ncbi:hypothetical protein [Paenibacillus periandrae]|uniref:hypothetical protein n=1 Tax=Paenibacillus periandrae TaxID=1761741 RepID=UPI001F089B0F|nr:hypothetical protein [Paenibacillus periandrae]
MRPTFFEELKGMKRNNEFREVILMQAAKKMLADKKKKSRLQRLLQRTNKVKTIPKCWD